MSEETYGKKVHVWTEGEINALPVYGIWFYGLVRDPDTGAVLVGEIHPGFGYCNWDIYPDDGDGKPLDPTQQYADIGSDILIRSPEQLAAEHPGVIDDFRIEEELREPSVPFDFTDDRSLFLKLLDARYVIDWYLDNSEYAYYGDEISGCDNEDLYNHIGMLVKYGILQETTFGCYQLNKHSEIVQTLMLLDELVAETGENICD